MGQVFFFLSKGKVLKEINSQYDYRKKFFAFKIGLNFCYLKFDQGC